MTEITPLLLPSSCQNSFQCQSVSLGTDDQTCSCQNSAKKQNEEQLKGKVNSRGVKRWEFLTILVRFGTTNAFFPPPRWEVWVLHRHGCALPNLKEPRDNGSLQAPPTETPRHAPVRDVNLVSAHAGEKETECVVQLCGWQRRGITGSDRSYLTNPKQQL